MKTLLFSATLSALTALSFSAGAATQTFSGQLCQKLDTSPANVSYTATYGAHNATTAEMRVSCPVPVTNPPVTSGGTFKAVVYDRNPGNEVSCTLLVNDENGYTQWSGTRATTGTDPASKPLIWGVGPSVGTFYTMSCSVPGAWTPGWGHPAQLSHLATYSLTN